MPFTETPTEFTWEYLNDTWVGLFNTWIGNYDIVTDLTIGDSATDIVEDAFGISTSRGRNRDLQRTNAGSIGVTIRNEDRKYDPQYAGPLQSLIKPRIPIELKVDGLPVFVGTITDWDFAYDIGGQSTASISGADAFTFFAREQATDTAPQEASGARLNRVLDNLVDPWPSGERDIDAGNTTLHAATYGENALSYIQSIEESEGGIIFITKAGDVAMRQRQIQVETDLPEFTDAGDGIPYSNIEITFGTDLLANRVTVTSTEGTAIAINQESIDNNGIAEEDVSSLLASGSLQGLAEAILFRFGTPEYRIAAVTVTLSALTPAQRAEVLAMELGTQVKVTFTPNNIGSAISIDNKIIGISHDIQLGIHTMTFNFEDVGFPLFILDDPVAGILDNNEYRIGF